MAERRVQAPEIRGPVPFRPTPVQSSTYVRPPTYSGVGDNLGAIADALSPLNDALVRYGSQAAKQAQEGQPLTVQAKYGTMPFEEFQAKLSRGEIPEAQQEAFGALAGARYADEWNREIATWVSSPEYDGSVDTLRARLDESRAKITAGLPSDAAKGIFSRASQPFYERFLQGGVKQQAEQLAGQLDTNIMSQYRLIVDDGMAKGLKPDEIAAAVVSAGKANRNILNLPGPRQNAILFDVAREYALKGKTDVVQAILDHPRDGIGPLGKTSEYSVKGLQLLEAAREVGDKEARAANFDTLAEINAKAAGGTLTKKEADEYRAKHPWLNDGFMLSNLDQADRVRASASARAAEEASRRDLKTSAALAEDSVLAADYAASLGSEGGGLDRVGDITLPNGAGGSKVLSARERKEQTIRRRLAESKASLSSGADQRVQFEADLQWFSANKVVNPEWEAKLNGVQAAAATAVVSKGTVPASVATAADLYMDLHAKNPAYADMLVKDAKSAEWLETFRLYRQDGQNAEQAAVMASTAIAHGKDIPDPKVTDDDLRRLAGDALSGWFQPDYSPSSEDLGAIRQRVKLYKSRPAEQAVVAAVEWFKNTHTNVNGRAVYTAAAGTPSDFAQLVPDLLQEYVTLYGPDAGVSDASTLSVMPMTKDGAGAWLIVNAETGTPVLNLGDGRITTAMLDELRAVKARKLRDDTARGITEGVVWDRDSKRILMPQTPGLAPGGTSPTLNPFQGR